MIGLSLYWSQHRLSDPLFPVPADSDILQKEVPLYKDVMLPSTSDKLALPLSLMPPSDQHLVPSTSVDTKAGPDSSSTPGSHSFTEVSRDVTSRQTPF